MMIEEPEQNLNHSIQLYYGELMAFVLRKICSQTSAADIVQETFLRFIASKDTKAVQNPRAYLYRIARNLVVDESRKYMIQRQYVVSDRVLENIKGNEVLAEKRVEDRQKIYFLAEAIKELPPRCQQVFRMRKVELKSVEEIMEGLGISRNMVEKHLRRALIDCKRRVEEMEQGDRVD